MINKTKRNEAWARAHELGNKYLRMNSAFIQEFHSPRSKKQQRRSWWKAFKKLRAVRREWFRASRKALRESDKINKQLDRQIKETENRLKDLE